MNIKKIIIGTVLISILALQIGCTGKESETNINNNETIEQEAPDSSTTTQDKIDQTLIIDEFNSLVENGTGLVEIIKFVDENISLLSEENASIIINQLEEAQKENLPKLEEKFYSDDIMQKKMLDIYVKEFDMNKIKDTKDEELKDLLAETIEGGYKIETAEGMFFPIINYEFYKKYSFFVTDDMKSYIDIMAVESNKVPAKDGALVIKWEEVLNRALEQEQFINQYSNSMKINDVRQLYKKYVVFTLFGLNNTPLFSYDSKVISEEAKSVYMNAIENKENSELVNILRGFFDVLKEYNYKLTDEGIKYRQSVVEVN